MTFAELVEKIKLFLPSGEQFVGAISFEEYRFVVIAAVIIISIIILLITFIIKSKSVRIPLLTQLGLFFIAGGMIGVADGLLADFSDPVAIATRWIFVCGGFIIIFISATICYLKITARLKKPGQRETDLMPFNPEPKSNFTDPPVESKPAFKFTNPPGVLNKEDWRG